MSRDNPFGRQPLPVKVTLEGEPVDVRHWLFFLANRAEYRGDLVQLIDADKGTFTIFPRAVDD